MRWINFFAKIIYEEFDDSQIINAVKVSLPTDYFSLFSRLISYY